jgi:hypothetical protein
MDPFGLSHAICQRAHQTYVVDGQCGTKTKSDIDYGALGYHLWKVGPTWDVMIRTCRQMNKHCLRLVAGCER